MDKIAPDYTLAEFHQSLGKLMVLAQDNTLNTEAIDVVIAHIDLLERLVEEVSNEDFFGSEGWEHYVGLK